MPSEAKDASSTNDCTTISRELKRNPVYGRGSVYEPLHAQAKAENRKELARGAKHPLKNKDIPPQGSRACLVGITEEEAEKTQNTSRKGCPQAQDYGPCVHTREVVGRYVYYFSPSQYRFSEDEPKFVSTNIFSLPFDGYTWG